MRCRFCGREFDSGRGLHVHQSEAHSEVDKEFREFLDNDVEEIKDAFESSDWDREKLLEAEAELADREEVKSFLRTESTSEISPEEIEKKIDVIDDIENQLEESLHVQKERKKMQEKKRKLKQKEESLNEEIEEEQKVLEDKSEDLEDLEEQREELEKQVSSLKTDVRELKKEKNSVESTVEKYRHKRKSLENKIDELYSKISDLNV